MFLIHKAEPSIAYLKHHTLKLHRHLEKEKKTVVKEQQ